MRLRFSRFTALIRAHPRISAVAVLALATIALALWIRLGPIPAELLDDRASASTIVVDRRGVPLYEARAGDGTRSMKLSADALPPWLVSATVAAEDRRFWSHPGVDPIAMARALERNAVEWSVVEGGSTISQQVAKLLLTRQSPRRRRGLTAKIHEAFLALRLEHRFTKRELLAMYLNLAAYGNQIVGAERASRAYFGCAASMLTPAQSAFLAGLPQRPSGFNPYRSRAAAMSRQRVVLRRMRAAGALSADQARDAEAERLTFTAAGSPFGAPHFVEMVLAAAGDARPARIQTTIDGGLQADISGIIQSYRELLQKHGASNVAIVVLDNATADWIAWEGSGDYADASHGGTINGPRAPRQPGSALKPFTYALAFEKGFTPASVLPDVPSHFPTAEAGVLYSPRNYDGRYRGPMLARRALAGSENVPAVALASELGVPALLRFLLRAGFTTFDRNASYYGLGVTLGNAEVRLDEMVAAYSAFARGGEWLEPRSTQGHESARRTIVSPRTAFWITDILADPEAREYTFGRGGNLEFPFPVAVKTGTSQAYHDNWTIGYSRNVTVGVWVGNFDRTPLRDSTGVTGAGPIFHAVMLAAERRASFRQILPPEGESHGDPPAIGDPPTTSVASAFRRKDIEGADLPIVVPPSDTAPREICALSGLAANAWCPTRRQEWVAADRGLPCSWHHLDDHGLLVIWPPEYRQWAQTSGLLADTRRTVAASTASERNHVETPRRPALTIVNPPAGATYLIDPTLRREFQTLAFRATADRSARIVWSVNGQDAGTASSDTAFMWPLAAGRHHITARDDQGRTAETTIVVR
jgi:penicillin-binding protein 1C